MPILLYTYLITEILGPFFASLLIINAILFLGKLSSLLDMIFSFGVSFADFARISIYLLPNLLLFSIPMASILGVVVSFTRLTSDNEILAMKAAGIGLPRLLVPVIIIAIFSSGLSLLTSTRLIPAGNIALKQTFFQLAKEKIDKGLKEKEFSDNLKNVVIYVDKIDEQTRQWQGVFISDLRNRKYPTTIMAETGDLQSDPDNMVINLNLRQGSVHRSSKETSQTISFESYNLSLPMTGSSPVRKIGKKDLSPGELLAKANELSAKSSENPQRQKQLRDQITSLMIEFHKRFALPVGCLILTILALPLALQSRPGQRPVGLPLGLFFFFLYYVSLSLAKSLAETSGLNVGIIMWSPDIIFGLFTMIIVRIAARDNNIRTLEKMLDMISQSIAFCKTMPRRLRR
ncbi:MAG: LptF/LptG family permease [Thermodesulfobacteriota bacterium]